VAGREIVVLNFGARMIADQTLRAAAVARVRESIERGSSPVAICSPLATPAGGEISLTATLVDALSEAGVRAIALTRGQIGTQGLGEIDERSAAFVAELVERGLVPVVTGAMPHGSAARAGARAGSDVLAVELGSALEAASVVIYTDADGVLSGDPRRISGVRSVERIGHVEIMELAQRGASVVSHAAAVAARARGTRYEIRNVSTDRGTIVREDVHVERDRVVSTITASSDVALVTVRMPRAAPHAWRWEHKRDELLERFAERDVPVEMMQFTRNGARFVSERKYLDGVAEQIAAVGLRAQTLPACARLCIVGANVRGASGLLLKILRTLTDAKIQALHVADSNVTISVIVAEPDAASAERSLHEALVVDGARRASSSFRFDAVAGRLHVRGVTHRLGERQARLLQFLIENDGRTLEAGVIARAVFGTDGKSPTSALRVHMHNLRKKLEEDPEHPRHLITVPNKGYLFVH
jgi:aspartate kinase